MDFEKMVTPLFAKGNVSASGVIDWHAMSGFLARVNDQTFLVTVAHLGDYIPDPRSDWSHWSDRIFLGDTDGAGDVASIPNTLREYELFFEGYKGKRVPRFKHYLRLDQPGIMADIILLPLDDEDPIVRNYQVFNLPADIGEHEPGAEVTQLGRRDGFPRLSVAKHKSTLNAGPVRMMNPGAILGDSGGPVINSEGKLLGMNYCISGQYPGNAMLMLPEAIIAIAASKKGIAPDWPPFLAGQPAVII